VDETATSIDGLVGVHSRKFVMFAGKLCIEVAPADKIAFISEELCIGCGICAKVSRVLFVSCFPKVLYYIVA